MPMKLSQSSPKPYTKPELHAYFRVALYAPTDRGVMPEIEALRVDWADPDQRHRLSIVFEQWASRLTASHVHLAEEAEGEDKEVYQHRLNVISLRLDLMRVTMDRLAIQVAIRDVTEKLRLQKEAEQAAA